MSDAKPTVRVTVESEPHSEDLSGVVLNRPAPAGGAFLIRPRVEREIWREMRDAGAWYLSAEDLEDFDMFASPPGWRYPLQALRVLLSHGYALQIEDETAYTAGDLDRMFAPGARRAHYERKEAEHAERLRLEKEETRRRQAERERKGAEYRSWKDERLPGLEETYTGPARPREWWKPIAYFDKGTPDAWYTTGDRWYEATVDGRAVYRREYGNAVLFYAPPDVIDLWIEADFAAREERYGGARAAQHALRLAALYPDGGVIGADDAIRIVELRGRDAMIAQATREPWYVREGINSPETEAEAVRARFGIEAVMLGYLPYPGTRALGLVTHPTDLDPSGKPQRGRRVWRHPDGHLVGETYGGTFFDLSPEQARILDTTASGEGSAPRTW